jgi:DNA-binding NtrC family response regulator
MRPALSVLIVEDDADLRDLVCQLLQGAGAMPVGVANAEEATKVLASQQIDIVLCDYLLPGRNGVTFLRDVRIRHPEVRCLAMTGHPDPFILGRGHDDGYFVLTKPFDPTLLLALVDGWGGQPRAMLPPTELIPIQVSARS